MSAPGVRDSGRLEAYSDAIFSIVATVMIVPIAHTEVPQDQDFWLSFYYILVQKLLVYIFTFLVVCGTWSRHVWLFETIDRVDEFIVLLNLALMMVVTFLPFTFTLLGSYPDTPMAVLSFSITIMFVFWIQCVMIYHAFKHEEILAWEVRQSSQKKNQRNNMYWTLLTPVVIALIAACLVPLSPLMSDLCLLLILFGNFVRKYVIKAYNWCRAACNRNADSALHEPNMNLRHRLLTEPVSKERTECFSDGVFAIVATLIILDICENNIPTREEVKDIDKLMDALTKDATTFLAYGGTFVTVTLQWYVHHSLLQYVCKLNRLMSLFNYMALLSVGMMPLAFRLTSQFEENKFGDNESRAIQLNCLVIFCAGIFQMAMWITALFAQEDHLIHEGHYGGKDHAYVTLKLMVYPLLSLAAYFASFATSVQVVAFVLMQMAAVVLFLLLYLLSSLIQRICMTSADDDRLIIPPHSMIRTSVEDESLQYYDQEIIN